jgi:hypothetical protein
VMVKKRRRKGLLMQGIFWEDHEDGKSRAWRRCDVIKKRVSILQHALSRSRSYQRVDYTISFGKEYTGVGEYARAGYLKMVSVLLVRFICLSCEKILVWSVRW